MSALSPSEKKIAKWAEASQSLPLQQLEAIEQFLTIRDVIPDAKLSAYLGCLDAQLLVTSEQFRTAIDRYDLSPSKAVRLACNFLDEVPLSIDGDPEIDLLTYAGHVHDDGIPFGKVVDAPAVAAPRERDPEPDPPAADDEPATSQARASAAATAARSTESTKSHPLMGALVSHPDLRGYQSGRVISVVAKMATVAYGNNQHISVPLVELEVVPELDEEGEPVAPEVEVEAEKPPAKPKRTRKKAEPAPAPAAQVPETVPETVPAAATPVTARTARHQPVAAAEPYLPTATIEFDADEITDINNWLAMKKRAMPDASPDDAIALFRAHADIAGIPKHQAHIVVTDAMAVDGTAHPWLDIYVINTKISEDVDVEILGKRPTRLPSVVEFVFGPDKQKVRLLLHGK
jgi:hypothetical protein